MSSIIGHRGIADTIKLARGRREDCRARQKAFLPCRAVVGGGYPADIGGAAVIKTTDLGGRNNGRAIGIAIRLDLRLVLACCIGVGIAAQLQKGNPWRGRSYC